MNVYVTTSPLVVVVGLTVISRLVLAAGGVTMISFSVSVESVPCMLNAVVNVTVVSDETKPFCDTSVVVRVAVGGDPIVESYPMINVVSVFRKLFVLLVTVPEGIVTARKPSVIPTARTVKLYFVFGVTASSPVISDNPSIVTVSAAGPVSLISCIVNSAGSIGSEKVTLN